jgi:hypothetical protein
MKVAALVPAVASAVNVGSQEHIAVPITTSDEYFEAVSSCLNELLGLSEHCSLAEESTKCVELAHEYPG